MYIKLGVLLAGNHVKEVTKTAVKTGKLIQCEYCGATVYKTLSQYNKRKHHFCSNKCQSLLKREQAFENRSCEICGENFYVSKKSTQRFCSTKCQNQWQLGNTGFHNKRFAGGFLKCKFCGNEFLVGKYKYDDGKDHFCSAQCRRDWYLSVWSQSEEWRDESRKRAVQILKNNPVTTQTKPQVRINELLDSLQIKYINEQPFVYYSIDNYLPGYNLAIEVMGDYWHSSPLKYIDQINDRQKHIISRDRAKHSFIAKQYGIEILYLWESDIMKNESVCSALIQKYIAQNGVLDNYHSFNYFIEDNQLQLKDELIVPRQQIAC